MKLYMIRHGQSEANIARTYGGQNQIPLTEEGREEAKRIAPLLKDLKFDKVYSSDLSRAMDTQELAYPCEDVERLELLREMDVGELAGKRWEDCTGIYGPIFETHRAQSNFVPYGGEDRKMIGDRAQKFLKMLEESPYERVAAFSHNGFICSVMRLACGLTPDDGRLVTKNCAISVFEYDGNRWMVGTWNYNGEL